MKRPHSSLFPLFLLIAACGGSGTTTEETAVLPVTLGTPLPEHNIPDNDAILAMAYDTDYQVPDNFYVDERVETTVRSYSLHHVLDASKSYELCTNDLVVAQAWEQADNDSRAVNGQYITSIENDRYFEFVRELEYTEDVGNITEPTSPGYARVFKCDYVQRDGVDRNLRDGYAGHLNSNPMSDDTLKDFVEYLWQFRFFNASRKFVADSYSNRDSSILSHTLVLAFVVNQGTDRCDRIDVVEWRFDVDLAQNEVNRTFNPLRSFEAEVVHGAPQLCN